MDRRLAECRYDPRRHGTGSELHTATGKIFAATYALYSGLIVLVVAGVLFAPVFHRFLHRFHLEEEDDASSRD